MNESRQVVSAPIVVVGMLLLAVAIAPVAEAERPVPSLTSRWAHGDLQAAGERWSHQRDVLHKELGESVSLLSIQLDTNRQFDSDLDFVIDGIGGRAAPLIHSAYPPSQSMSTNYAIVLDQSWLEGRDRLKAEFGIEGVHHAVDLELPDKVQHKLPNLFLRMTDDGMEVTDWGRLYWCGTGLETWAPGAVPPAGVQVTHAEENTVSSEFDVESVAYQPPDQPPPPQGWFSDAIGEELVTLRITIEGNHLEELLIYTNDGVGGARWLEHYELGSSYEVRWTNTIARITRARLQTGEPLPVDFYLYGKRLTTTLDLESHEDAPFLTIEMKVDDDNQLQITKFGTWYDL